MDPKSEFQSSGFELNDDVKVKIEIDHTIIKLEPLEAEAENGTSDKNLNSLEYQALDKIQKYVKSEDLELVDCTGSYKNLEGLKATVLEGLKNDKISENESLVFKEEIPDYHSNYGSDKIKLEADELIIKHEYEEIDSNLRSNGHRRARRKKDQSIANYQCYHCSFETKIKSCIQRHVVMHMDVTRLETFSCQPCNFQSRYQTSWMKHMLRKHPDNFKNRTLFKCDRCNYRTRYRRCLKKHASVHESASAMVMFSCRSCNFQTVHKAYWSKHMKSKHTEEAEKNKCRHCSYRSQDADSLRRHVLKHKGGALKFRCEQCHYQTIKRRSLERHMVIHTDASKVVMFSCLLCDFQSKHKYSVDRHALLHRDDAPIYRCAHCCYQSKQKYSLRRHIRSHNKEKKRQPQAEFVRKSINDRANPYSKE